jgi:uncharacterized protein YndB with AHSA1/START domain
MSSRDQDFMATAATRIDAPLAKVWDALVNPAKIRQYMLGSVVGGVCAS